MDLESVKRLLQKEGGAYETTVDSLPQRFFEPFVCHGLKVDLIEKGRIICSFTVPPRLLNTATSLHGGATATLVDLIGSAVIYTMGSPMTGVSVEINVSYLDGAYVGDTRELQILSLEDHYIYDKQSVEHLVHHKVKSTETKCPKMVGHLWSMLAHCIGQWEPGGVMYVDIRGEHYCYLHSPERAGCLRLTFRSHNYTDRVSDHSVDEIEVEGKALRVGKAIAVVSVDLKNKKTGKIIAQGRHTKYLALSSKL